MCQFTICVVLMCLSVGVSSFAMGKEKITGHKCGVEASSNLVHHSPWLVYLEYYRRDNQLEIRCGGSLIGPRHVVTAAHCVKLIRYSSLYARLGEYDLDTEIDCVHGVCADPVVRIEVDEIFVHPDYDGNERDIAVLRLKEDAPYTDFIRPICLPSGHLEDNVTFTASGFGEIPSMGTFSHVKKILPLPNWDINECRAAYQDSVLPQKIICAGGEKGLDTCRGDSGGPLVRFGKVAELWGVTILGNTRCGAEGYPGIYSSVPDYVDWIETVVQI